MRRWHLVPLVAALAACPVHPSRAASIAPVTYPVPPPRSPPLQVMPARDPAMPLRVSGTGAYPPVPLPATVLVRADPPVCITCSRPVPARRSDGDASGVLAVWLSLVALILLASLRRSEAPLAAVVFARALPPPVYAVSPGRTRRRGPRDPT